MNNSLKYCVLLFLLVLSLGYGQISPGDLSQSHADLEGMSNCTLCHELGTKVTDKKCLECHKEIQSLINKKDGYHANPGVVKKDCFECHSDHHGRNFDMIRFDEDAFNHDLTGYELEGKHEEVDCRKCHVSENIQNRQISKRKNTFLGLDESCLSCHDDVHQKTLPNDCMACHNMEGFKPAPNFNHDTADFKLEGEHINVDCIECHQITTRNGKEFQAFNEIPFNDCIACHQDPHNEQLPGQCSQCHTETSFATFAGQENFDHNATNFTLKESHQTTDCFACHAVTGNPLTVFQDKKSISENSCISCHQDVHDGEYGNECVKCHRETSFLTLRSMDFFDHTVTDYPLEGKHMEVDCRQCHEKRFSAPIDFSACKNCHDDYHRGEFKENEVSPDCVECHSLENGFDYSLYTLEQHQNTAFPLEGAHNATPCYACHVSETEVRWSFRNLGTDCVDCHKDIHEGYMSEKYYPEAECKVCHVNEAWTLVSFDHNLTEWPLDGKHTEVDCRSCHFVKSENNTNFKQTFNNLGGQCITCHENIHDDAFAIEGVTDCTRCHVTDSWFPSGFNHNRTAFPLEGQHAKITCSACHEVASENGETEVIYKLGKFKCIDCHL